MNPPKKSDGTLTKYNRLRHFSQMMHVFREGKKSESEWAVIALVRRKAEECVIPNHLGQNRLGILFARRCIKKAVQRNLLKRLIRECFRTKCKAISGYDIVVRITKEPPLYAKHILHGACEDLFKKALP